MGCIMPSSSRARVVLPLPLSPAMVVIDGLSSLIQAAELMERTGQRNSPGYAPVLFLPNETVSRAVKLILTFGYPARPRDPESRSVEEWSARAKRKPFDEVVRRV